MKRIVLALFTLFSLPAIAQSNLSVTVSDSGVAAPGVAVFYYNSPTQFFNGGNWMNPDYDNYDSWTYSSGNGIANFTLTNVAPGDTVFWASQDCTGNWVWGAGTGTSMNPNITGTLWLSCLPAACDAYTRVEHDSANASLIYTGFPLRDSTFLSSIPGAPVFEWTFANSTVFGTNGVFNLSPATGQPGTYSFKVYQNCSAIWDSISYQTGGSSGSGVTCNPAFMADTLGQTTNGYQMLFRDASNSNGSIINYSWDFGDGNSASGIGLSNALHTYANGGTYAVCLSITSVLGPDTCSATYCDSAVFVPNGSGNSGSPINCNASYAVDTVNSGLFQNQLVLWETSTSNANIISYSWDFGNGTTINAQYPSHTYTTTGVYPVCLTITAIDSAGVDSCTSTFCDSIGFDANGNLVYKAHQNGFTINVIDPATVSVEDLVLESSLEMFPNPASEVVNLSWDQGLEVESIKVYSISGSLVKSIAVEQSKAEISGLAPGAYLVKVETVEASKTLRLIVQ